MEIRTKSSSKGPFLKILFYYYKQEWKLTLIMLIFCLIIVSCSLLLPILTYQMTKAITKELSEKQGLPFVDDAPDGVLAFWGISWINLIYVSLADVVIYCIVSFYYDYVAYIIGRKIEISLRNRCLENLVRQDISYYSNKKIGEILTKVVSDTQTVGDQAVQVPLQIGLSIFEIAASSALMFVFTWKLGLITLLIFAVCMILMGLCFFATRKKVLKVREIITSINGDVTDRVATVRLIKSAGTENYETKRFIDVHKEYYKKSKAVGHNQALMLTTMWGGIFVLKFFSIIAAMLVYGMFSTPEEGLLFFKYTFAPFQLAESMMVSPLFQVMNALFGLVYASVASERVNDTIKAKSIMNHHYFDGEVIEKIEGDILFKGIEFAYPEKPSKLILPKFDFTFKESKSYAFVGETGSGKSTIAKLLLRFYDPTSGSIIINKNINLKDANLSSYLKHVGYVEQDPQILYGDVYENVTYGSFNVSKAEIISACKKAELHDLVMSWPDKYETILGERGFMLSGGQKQRLVIARMFLKNPQLLILDEATSALDNIVEREIQEKLNTLMKGRTTVTIAHRLSTIKNVDEIIVLGANGKGIVQRGTFEELRDKEGHFQNLYKAGLID
ncbi:ABC transporter ATP-binding protein [Spiroplasma litorale]|uniref:ABC transporter ATP-binding protein n=1 Tax=Spiroplasma litorale TaxID=216942 RepID=A0A0K1W0F5_9MOLU|nr:ABC transporter ATP-binding protein [Spiroplasma litorale]AKX33779.1 ABC transporter ATP-binding protein [Spiroplasma litorale]